MISQARYLCLSASVVSDLFGVGMGRGGAVDEVGRGLARVRIVRVVDSREYTVRDRVC